MKTRRLLCGVLFILTSMRWPLEARAWSKGYGLIRLWAVSRLRQWQRKLGGQQSLDRLCQEYTSPQDKHGVAGTRPSSLRTGLCPEYDSPCTM